MELVTWVQIQDEAICISQSVDTLEKGMNPTILSTPIGKLHGRLV